MILRCMFRILRIYPIQNNNLLKNAGIVQLNQQLKYQGVKYLVYIILEKLYKTIQRIFQGIIEGK